jgi:16S rRNA (uracil1498-N3)-methyltransferase
MRVSRIYVAQNLASLSLGSALTLEPMASAHLIKVLRLRAGTHILLFCGDGFDYSAEIVTPRAEACVVKLGARSARASESALQITLIQALCRGEKMDWVLEKATELGVHAVLPVTSEYTDVQLSAERADKRRTHWQRVVISACEQCQRAVLPEIAPLCTLASFCAQQSNVLSLVLTPNAPKANELALFQIDAPTQVRVAIGPEGGFSETDLHQLKLAGFHQLSLGPRVLRTETAGLAAIAMLQARWGDFC